MPEQMGTIEVLRAARALISEPERWCQGAMARRRDGLATSPGSRETAVSWCAEGCVEEVGGLRAPLSADVARGELIATVRAYGGRRLTDFNDTHTHKDVLELFDRTIARLERRNRGET